MGRPICRPWPRRPRRRRSRGETGRRALLLAGLAGIAAALLVICAVNARVRPVAEELALAKLNNAVTAIVNQAVEEAMASGAVSYSDIVTLQTDLSGGITAILTDPIKLNTLRTQLLGDLVEQVDSLDSKDLGIPLGNLTSLIPLSGYGPLLPVRVLAAAAPDITAIVDYRAEGILPQRISICWDQSDPAPGHAGRIGRGHAAAARRHDLIRRISTGLCCGNGHRGPGPRCVPPIRRGWNSDKRVKIFPLSCICH